MFGFSDYFEKEKLNTGYESREEEIKDSLNLIDMLLEHYLDKRTASSEGLVFSRGMKMTEAEIESYYFKAPKERESIGFDDDFAKEVNEAIAFIKKREEKTDKRVLLPLKKIGEAFELSDAERLALVIALSVQLDMKYTRLYGFISNEPSQQYPTLGVFVALYETFIKKGTNDAINTLADENKAFRMLCLDRQATSDTKKPFLHLPLVLHPTLLSYITGDFTEDSNIDNTGLPESYKKAAKMLSGIKEEGTRIYIECDDPEDVVPLLYKADEKELNLIDFDELALKDEGIDILKLQGHLIRAVLNDGRILIRIADIEKLLANKNELKRFPVVYIFGKEKMPSELLHTDFCTMPKKLVLPDAEERLYIWKSLIKEENLKLSSDISVDALADTYGFSYSRIKKIVKQAALFVKTEKLDCIERKELLKVIFRFNEANFKGLATEVHTSYVWDDIEMAASQRKRLLVACDRYRYRDRIDEKYGVAKRNAYGNGVSVLMYGAPGTGKTMAAQVVANELGLPLYRVDVSQIFSKYIGETEKNLGQIFEEAKKANVILFFDEADALFTKRTEVGDSNDRYANAETAYLLQKIEEHNGMTILATNLYHNFDSAFVRRITYVVHIDSPDEDTRMRLWKNTLPETCKFARDVDFEFLAEGFEISGSNIKSILQTAAYMAGARDFGGGKEKEAKITMEDIVVSLRYELEKLGRIIDSTDFKNYGVYL